MRTWCSAGTLAAAIAALAVTAAPAAAWTPQAAGYGVGEEHNLTVHGAGGTLLAANVYYPTDTKTGQAAPGPFPVIVTQTPYGKDTGSEVGGQLGGLAGTSDYLVQRGYIQVVADVRGTGGSEGEWGLFDPIQGQDGADLVNWAAALPHSDGKVGLLGASYLGINQFETAADAGPSHVKAMFPIISGDDLYRDTAFAGGFPDIEFSAFYLGLTAALNTEGPLTEGTSDAITALTDHVHDLGDFDAELLANVETGGDDAYDQTYWGARNPVQYIPQIVKDKIPAFLVGGWYDLFQRGELMNYAALQNAYDGRPTLAPMTPGQAVSPRYQLIEGPWYHVTAGLGLDYHGLDMNGVELAWFDHWLKGVDTGITDTDTPMHLEDLSSGDYVEASRYPLNQAAPTAYYLQPGGGLSPVKPTTSSTGNTIIWDGSEIPCTSSTEQWIAGLGPLVLSFFGLKDPCTANATLSQIGPGTVNYTTAPFTTPMTLAGPIGATLYATSTTRDTEFVVQVTDVAPNGAATSLTSGLLEGNQRAVDPSMTWYAPDGNPLLPWHPYTKAAQTPVTPGQVTRFDVEIFPTLDTLQPGHRLRITIASSDFPHALPELTQLPNLLGGIYTIEHSPSAPSSVELPLVPAAPGTTGGLARTTGGPLGCPRASGNLTPTSLGPVRLGMTRAQAESAFVASSTRGHANMDFFCLTPNGIRVAYAADQVVIALTANASYALRGVRPGKRLAGVARRLGATRGITIGTNTWYLIPDGAGRGVLKVQHGVIEEIGVAARRLTGSRAAARRFLTSFS
ncbi:MAG TPA: CocE/NonD family hydrolase [Solirubrobacteraceae bacterium]|nr:CocE/NonD family hydrolase [Solirubrobacteraceae bacterium]